jgi:hypothetical protein
VKSLLLCTFVKGYAINNTLENLKDEYYDYFDNDKIFLLGTSEKNSYILSYNLVSDVEIDFYRNTVLVHRKKETNTLYTINAINDLIKEINNGVLDKNYKIEWELYRNSILLSNNGVLTILPTTVKKIYRI